MNTFSPSPLKPYFWKIDFRHLQLVWSFIPLLVWAGAINLTVIFWHRHWSLLAGCVLFYLGGLLTKRLCAINYALAMRARFAPLPGVAGVDFLAFEAEAPETAHK